MALGFKQRIYEFEGFQLDAGHFMLYRNGEDVGLPRKAIETLIALIERRGQIVDKDELMSAIWKDSIVEESNLSQYLHLLRKTLGTTADKLPFIETLRRRGYRFNGSVIVVESGTSQQPVKARVSLIARETATSEVVELLSQDAVRLVTLTGVGGVGKTSLARAVESRMRDSFAGQVIFIELAPITNCDLVLSSIASSLDIKSSDNGSILSAMRENLEARPALLVLDNFEQVIAAAPQIAELLNAVPGIKLLITSRVFLHISAETEFVVPPLATPSNIHGAGSAEMLKEIAGYASVRLFVNRAQDSKPGFELTAENAASVAEICHRLDGLPLAIELAAPRIKLMSPPAILMRLQRQLDLLTGGPNDAPERQRTMRATIAWSFNLLDESEQRLFARLAVFAGGFTLEAAERICGRQDRDIEIVNSLTSLVEHNLLIIRDSRPDARFQMLEVVREYAIDILEEYGETQSIRRRHAEYFLGLGEEAEPLLDTPRSVEWLERLEVEHDNLRAALKWAEYEDHALGQRLAGAIWRFWWLHGHIREGCEQLAAFLSLSADFNAKVRIKLLSGASSLNRLRGRADLSRLCTEQALVLARNTDDGKSAALSLHQLGFLLIDEGDLEKAAQMFAEGLELAIGLGDKQLSALIYNGIGEVSRMRNDLVSAGNFYRQALELNRELGDRARQATNLINLGATALQQGDVETAGELYLEGLKISSAIADMNATLYCLEGVAGAYWARRNPEKAALLFGAAAAARKATNLLIEPADVMVYENSVATVRECLPERFSHLFTIGNEMKLEQAVQIAILEPIDF